MSVILQGTTPSLQIVISKQDFLIADVEQLEIIMWQEDKSASAHVSAFYNPAYSCGDCTKTVLSYGLDDVVADRDTNSYTVEFSEADTMSLDPNRYLYWQMRCRFYNGSIVGTKRSEPIEVAGLRSAAKMS